MFLFGKFSSKIFTHRNPYGHFKKNFHKNKL